MANNSGSNEGLRSHHQTHHLKPLKQPLDPAVCQKAARYAIRVCEEMSKRSQLLNAQGDVAVFDRDSVLPHIGELLGRGGFNSVYELKTSALRDTKTGKIITSDQQRLAIKFLSDDAMMVPEEFCNGAADLLMEAKYLTALAAYPHPALIQLHGVCDSGPNGFTKTDRAGFFLVIDRLYDTLDRRMDVWKELKRRRSGQKKMMTALFLQRLLVIQDIASALRHLHKLNVIFRDLKPDNVGFDYDGRVKLFDFGLAKELDPRQRNQNGLYNMSGGTGSRRFMAPEVALLEPYGLSADMYSLAILMWEVLSLRKAFSYLPVEEHRERVVKGGERLELDSNWSSTVHHLLESCWHRDPFKRPPAKEVYKMIRNEIQTIVNDEFPGENGRRKSC